MYKRFSIVYIHLIAFLYMFVWNNYHYEFPNLKHGIVIRSFQDIHTKYFHDECAFDHAVYSNCINEIIL